MQRKLYKSIKAKNISIAAYLHEVWRSRGLIITFAKRDLKVQYAQTYLGVLWSIIQPVTGLFIFNFFFHRVVKLDISVPYPLFALTGIMGWFYFTQLVGQGGTSLMLNQNLIKKVNFPRLILPISKALVGLVEFFITFCVLLILLFYMGYGLSFRVVVLPFVVAINIITGLSVAIWLSALTIRFRDFHHLIPYLIGFGVWLTPVFYPITIVPEGYKWVYYLHPVANFIGLYRWIFLGIPVDAVQALCSFAWAVIVLLLGISFFIRNEKFVADHI
jgi:lipopolysaccharide transport system permease protein